MADKLHTKLTEDQVAIIASPARFEILDALVALEAASVNELAAHLGRSPKGLYHHIRIMVASGLVVETGSRRSGAREEAIYAPMSDRIAIPKSASKGLGVKSAMRLATREYLMASELRAGAARFIRFGMRLSDADRKELHRKMEEVSAWIADRSDPEGKRVACTIVLAELE